MMIHYEKDKFEAIPGAIYTFDIETTSIIYNPYTGEWEAFDYNKPAEFYTGLPKAGIPYIWMFGVNDTVYYGENFEDVETVLRLISTPDQKQYLWIHNAAFEFQFMRDFLDKYTIDNMIARASRKPIAYTIKELNIEVRCTYMLTNLSLEKAAERYTNVRKLSGQLDYNKARSPRTVAKMTPEELDYCEYDIITLYHIVDYFREKYKQLRWIPYTQTGEVRKEFRKRVSFGYVLKMQKRVPDDRMYLMLQKAFQGGMTHGNCLYVNKVITGDGIGSYDIASSYPTTFLLKMPMYKFRKIPAELAYTYDRDRYAILYHVRFHGVEAAKLNKYILCSKIAEGEGIYQDNGRLVRCSMCELYITEIDYDIITKSAYHIERVEVIEAYAAYKDYMPRELIEFALELYNDKTKLKGVIGREDFYMKQKQMLNGL